jgi:hypothetical protein
VKTGDAVFSNDRWAAVVSYNLTQFEAAVSTVVVQLSHVKALTNKTGPLGEFGQVDEALLSLRTRLASIQRYLPRSIRKRSLFDIGGSALKLLFGVATTLDLHSLHEAVEDLHRRQDSVAHSIDKQLTYFRQLDETVTADHSIVTHLSLEMRKFAQDTQASFQEVVNKLEWSKNQRTMADLLRRLEFALNRLEARLSELLVALQQAVHHRVPVNLIPPRMLERILLNVSLGLPDPYELVRGVQDLSFYYEYIESAVVSTQEGFLVSLSIPLRDVTTQYEIFRLFVFPTLIVNNTYGQFLLKEQYLAVNIAHRTHFPLTEELMRSCSGPADMKICPADQAVFTNDIATCVLSLYLQADAAHTACQKQVFTRPPEPILFRHGAAVVFYTPAPRMVFFRCRGTTGWDTSSVNLHGAGVIEGAAPCHVSTGGQHLRPIFSAQTGFQGRALQLYIPDIPVVDSSAELAAVRRLSDPSFFQEDVKPLVRASYSLAELTAQFQKDRVVQPARYRWYLPCISAVGTVIVMSILYYLLIPYHSIITRPWLYCVCRKLPVAGSVKHGTVQDQSPGQVESTAPVPPLPVELTPESVEPVPRFRRT